MHPIPSGASVLALPFLLPGVVLHGIEQEVRAVSRVVVREVRGFLGFLGLNPVPAPPAVSRPLAARHPRSASSTMHRGDHRQVPRDVPLPLPVEPFVGSSGDAKSSEALPRVRAAGPAMPAKDRYYRNSLKTAIGPLAMKLISSVRQNIAVSNAVDSVGLGIAVDSMRLGLQRALLDALCTHLGTHGPLEAAVSLVGRLPSEARRLLAAGCKSPEAAAKLLCEALADCATPEAGSPHAGGVLATDLPALFRSCGGGFPVLPGVDLSKETLLGSRVHEFHISLCDALTPFCSKQQP